MAEQTSGLFQVSQNGAASPDLDLTELTAITPLDGWVYMQLSWLILGPIQTRTHKFS